ncbi:hypothetical protein G4D61_11115 [Bacillus ginsengihumi]|uniref:Uncharacterized protein n=1 Tax=Heyndrickxia ginsengihumi TaxID=363870 RepID=A0A6M0P894_9BACI|nr:hypothetical protein [Heyndrickxia ginsengihumi]NEY20505.1 hypothetical protein [Heyndrickxia ginsengihumi]
MGYKVLNDFIEKEHNNTLYKEGEEYPKQGFEADPDRVAYLQKKRNKYKIAFLGEEVKPAETTVAEDPKQDVQTAQTVDAPKTETADTAAKTAAPTGDGK